MAKRRKRQTRSEQRDNSGNGQGVIGRPFPPGVSGNPGGRPKGLAQFIRDMTANGDELVGFMLRVFRGKVKGASLRRRMEAATWLADRSFGRPPMSAMREPEPAPEPEEPKPNYELLSDDDLAEVRRLSKETERILAKVTPGGSVS